MENTEQEKATMAQQYDKLASKFKERYLAGKERGREAMAVALEKSHEQMAALGEFSAEHGAELKKYMARDMDQTMADAQNLGEEAKERLNPGRLGAGALASLAAVLESTGNALQSLSEKTREKLTYKTGEITSAGTLTCQACGEAMRLKETGYIPPCPKCSATLFNKGY
ncbi:MAG: zinc ribbon-containing protein [Sulfuriferula multivorans]|uniref:Zinc ribbon-containing protein n=1 Tax=Sulfuriferula multivorans TaxID=1559896 RepID=A0A7C9JV56_9PROT|nr:zinc ribbon-containing protein [Sulfuriferula multivorans]